jgi:hypothetical protein
LELIFGTQFLVHSLTDTICSETTADNLLAFVALHNGRRAQENRRIADQEKTDTSNQSPQSPALPISETERKVTNV